jgi:hypothetical protein
MPIVATPLRLVALPCLLVVAAAACSSAPDTSPSPTAATLIVNATVLDGTGADGRAASVRIEGARIVEVGTVQARADDRVVDGSGLVLAPGFIDTHSHADGDIFEHRDATAVVSQGITTVVVGQDGGSPDTLSEFFGRLEQSPAAVNVASYVGHNTVRDAVMGEDSRRPRHAAGGRAHGGAGAPGHARRGAGPFERIGIRPRHLLRPGRGAHARSGRGGDGRPLHQPHS